MDKGEDLITGDAGRGRLSVNPETMGEGSGVRYVSGGEAGSMLVGDGGSGLPE